MRRLDIGLFALAFTVNVYGQSSVTLQPHRGPIRVSVPESPVRVTVPTSHASIQSTSAPLDSFFTGYMAAYHVPGVAACIVKKDTVAWQGYYGYANLPQNIPVTDSTIFMLASISKTVTATALMQLYEAGRFGLDDSVNGYLPFPVRNPSYSDVPITFKMLLTHTSSIRDNWNAMPYVEGDPVMPLATYLHEYFTPGGQFFDQSLNFYNYAPGTRWNYCNIAAALCGYLVEAISGVPFSRYCRDSIFASLQMMRTAWFLSDLDTGLIARPYTYSSGNYVDNGLYGFPDYPDGQLRTTATSLAKFLLTNINGGESMGSRILDSSTVRMMRTPWFTGGPGGSGEDQGLIWYTQSFGGRKLWGHTGGEKGVTTAIFLSENHSTGIVFLMNVSPDQLPWQTVVERLMTAADALTVGVQQAYATTPDQFQLHQNYPNPFNPSTTITYELPRASVVRLSVYDILGREVTVLVNERRNAGVHEFTFDGSNLASGLYFYRLQAGAFVQTMRLMILK